MMRSWPGFGRETHAYMRGRCCDLAFALSELVPDAEIVGIGGSPRFTDHAALRIGDLFVDARGISDEAGFREGLASPDAPLFPMTRDDLLGQMGLAHMPKPRSGDLTKARATARSLDRWRQAQPAPEPSAPPAP
jgi:hypothetical protein